MRQCHLARVPRGRVNDRVIAVNKHDLATLTPDRNHCFCGRHILDREDFHVVDDDVATFDRGVTPTLGHLLAGIAAATGLTLAAGATLAVRAAGAARTTGTIGGLLDLDIIVVAGLDNHGPRHGLRVLRGGLRDGLLDDVINGLRLRRACEQKQNEG
jgi:hypothetical protein